MGIPRVELPPIHQESGATITDEARLRLTSWGLTPEQIDYLTGLTGSYEYGKCPEKVEAMRVGYTYRGDTGCEQLVIPHGADAMRRPFGGQCSDIASLQLFDLHVGGFADSLKENLQTANITVAIVGGYSPTHFTESRRKLKNHLWCALIRDRDRDGMIDEEDKQKMVHLDGSFGVVMTGPKSGYLPVAAQWRFDDDFSVSFDLHWKFALPNFRIDPKLSSVTSERNIINNDHKLLGLSAEKRFIYSLGFGKTEDEIIPTIQVAHPNGTDNGFCYQNRLFGNIETIFSNKKLFDFSEGEWSEISRILDAASRIQIQAMPEGFNPNSQYTRKW